MTAEGRNQSLCNSWSRRRKTQRGIQPWDASHVGDSSCHPSAYGPVAACEQDTWGGLVSRRRADRTPTKSDGITHPRSSAANSNDNVQWVDNALDAATRCPPVTSERQPTSITAGHKRRPGQ